MKSFFYLFFIVLIIGGVAALSCPDKEAHLKALNAKREAATQNETGNALQNFATYVQNKLAGAILAPMLTVDNYLVCSVGTMTLGSETETLSIGLFNHVFVLDQE